MSCAREEPLGRRVGIFEFFESGCDKSAIIFFQGLNT